MGVRYDDAGHEYFLDGVRVPSVTQLLKRVGLVPEAWYTEASAGRGREVHKLCTDMDLGAIDDVTRHDSACKPWLLAYAKFLRTVAPTWTSTEEVFVSVHYRFAGRPDRVGKVWGAEAIVEIKSGATERWHGLQLALQDIVVGGLPWGVRKRYGLYLKKTGKFRLCEYRDRHEYDEAFEVIRQGTGA